MPQPRFVRVKDNDTGHEYDVREDRVPRSVTRLDSDRWPPVSRPRAPKHNVAKGGEASTPRTTTARRKTEES